MNDLNKQEFAARRVSLDEVCTALQRAEEKLRERIAEVGSPNLFPTEANKGNKWELEDASHWTSGFWPGCLWYLFELTGDQMWKIHARRWTEGVGGQVDAQHHDIGFMFNCSFGHALRLAGEDGDIETLLSAAKNLAAFFNPLVRMTRSWSWGSFADGNSFTVIMDNMMNLELLFWAARQPGGDPEWRSIAHQHALRCALEHVRENNSTYHLVVFNEEDGSVKERRTYQGYADESTWARGQAWAIYGFTVCYRETADPVMLETAHRVTDYYLDRLPVAIPPRFIAGQFLQLQQGRGDNGGGAGITP